METRATKGVLVLLALCLHLHQNQCGGQKCRSSQILTGLRSSCLLPLSPSLQLRGGKAVKARRTSDERRGKAGDSGSHVSDAAEEEDDTSGSQGSPQWLEEMVNATKRKRRKALRGDDLVAQFLAYNSDFSGSDSSMHTSDMSEGYGPNATQEMMMAKLEEMEAKVKRRCRWRR